jgi:4-aminobutyrate aminotransferase
VHHMSVDDALSALNTLFKTDIEPAKVAAIIIEPIQGEGGFCVTPVAFMQALRKICDQHGILLIADEIQTGFARTGKMFAMEHYGVVPDLMTLAKSLAGGMPLSGVCGRAEIMDAPNPGGLGGTYAGNALAVASALAVLDIIEEEKLVERANLLGQRLTKQLHETMQDATVKSRVSEVRGLGSMIAIEFKNPETGAPDADFTKKVQSYALEHGLLLLTCGVYGNVIRFLFPLTLPEAVMTEALVILDQALRVN